MLYPTELRARGEVIAARRQFVKRNLLGYLGILEDRVIRCGMRDPTFLGSLGATAEALPLPWDYWHEPGVSGFSPTLLYPQPNRVFGTNSGTFGLTSGTPMAVPFFVGRLGRVVTQLGLWVASSHATAVVNLGIYACAPPSAYDVYPTTLVADMGNITLSATGARYTPVSSVPLTNGLYWLVARYKSGGAAALRTRNNPSSGSGWMPGRNVLGYNGSGGAWMSLTATLPAASALPATFPAGAALNTQNLIILVA